MSARELSVSELYRKCNSAQFTFKTTEELELLEDIVGQPQAIEAVRFGIQMKQPGYHIFALGEAGTLTGSQGVIIPAGNIQHLMLRADVLEAVDKGLFHVYPVQDINEGIEILTGVPAGKADENGVYPPNSVNGKVQARLERMAEERKRFMSDVHGSDDD